MAVNEAQIAFRTSKKLSDLKRHIEYRPDIDGLRAIAVLAVLIFHAFPTVLQGGFVGVDVFFVISGYLISKVIFSTLKKDSFSIADFYSRRIRRIFPALVTVLASCLIFGWNTMLADDLALLAKHVLGGAGFASNLVLWGEAGYFDKASELKPLLHLWSLGIEEQFYVVWPLLIWAAWRLRISLLLIVAGIGLASFAVNINWIHEYPTATFYSPLSRAWELIIGAGLACLTLNSRSSSISYNRYYTAVTEFFRAEKARSAISIIGLLFLVFAMLRIKDTLPFPGKWALLPTVGTFLLIAAGPVAWVNRVLLSSRPMIAIGLISFPLYLWHWPLLTFARSANPEGLPWTARVGILFASAVLATLTYLYIEKPFRSGSRTQLKVSVLCASMCAAVVVSVGILKSGGFASRYPEIIQRATEYDLDGYRAALRNRVCFMDIGQDASQYAPECIDKGDAPLWVLWGDSGAAAIYSGLRGLAERSGQFRLAQFTSSACPPMIGFEGGNPACRSNNQWTIEKISQQVPDTVILAGMWGEYQKDLLASTIKQIQSAGVRKIIILGPAPAWKDTPSRISFNLWSSDPLHRVPSERLDYAKYGMGHDFKVGQGLDSRTETAEKELRLVAKETGALYISVADKMCNDEGCLTRESASSGAAFYLDIVHFTPHGANFAMRAIASELGITTP
ncbi:acyltransferase family protein [Pseudomonas vancouverensis]|uniref:Acyltransferase n=1 Tax=Pseudomonas vancouverensis TaxID=95300 RepID=A0A1H2MIL0_PSEVA|nr:acyltransferase family protein [Pseudomonas vancouverensis]KAB0490640.1 acyltransferase [Pseudomonas vancouverensis]TDB62903.1 acyltransferase [Pseudomonas vancouverensis]SDU92326.1 Peptidoglycan/LPS O-acetylase OafA/YrhL, contains acyltransferase and SGNH-hydrolase domains [Pseudomonas vancouverensis]